jgi:hypothetical protein
MLQQLQCVSQQPQWPQPLSHDRIHNCNLKTCILVCIRAYIMFRGQWFLKKSRTKKGSIWIINTSYKITNISSQNQQLKIINLIFVKNKYQFDNYHKISKNVDWDPHQKLQGCLSFEKCQLAMKWKQFFAVWYVSWI